jgi:hypothetical protein
MLINESPEADGAPVAESIDPKELSTATESER